MDIVPIAIDAKSETGEIEFQWNDQRTDLFTFFNLRCNCQCAQCVDEVTGKRILDPESVPQDITIQEMQLVGNYSLKITWSTGHDTGLYTWDFLRKLADGDNSDNKGIHLK